MKRLNSDTMVQGPLEESGNALVMCLVLLTSLIGFSAAQFVVVQKNLQSTSYELARSDLRKCAESGIALGMHDIKYNASGYNGKIGTSAWTTANDVGADGKAGTYDKGEGDQLPTIGEPNVNPLPVGPAELSAWLIVYVGSSGFAGTSKVVATAANSEASVTVESFLIKTIPQVPKVSAIIVDEGLAIDLKGNKFIIDGRDHKTDGTLIVGGEKSGIATPKGSPPGSNQSALVAQIPSKAYDQVIGAGGKPSVGEATLTMSVNEMVDSFKAVATKTLAPGAYTSPSLGTMAGMTVTYASGDLKFSGTGSGAGVLVIDGSLTVSGQFKFQGIVLVRGDVILTGGGSGVHIIGALVVGDSITAVDTTSTDLTLSGNADVLFSSAMIDMVQATMSSSYSPSYYKES